MVIQVVEGALAAVVAWDPAAGVVLCVAAGVVPVFAVVEAVALPAAVLEVLVLGWAVEVVLPVVAVEAPGLAVVEVFL